MILLDTSGLLAWLDADQRKHSAVVEAMRRRSPPYLLSPFVLAELDYLLSTRVGPDAQGALLDEVARGSYQLTSFSATQVGRAAALIHKLADLKVGLADASIAVLAQDLGVRDLLTLDERHFRVIPGLDGKPFRLLPADA